LGKPEGGHGVKLLSFEALPFVSFFQSILQKADPLIRVRFDIARFLIDSSFGTIQVAFLSMLGC